MGIEDTYRQMEQEAAEQRQRNRLAREAIDKAVLDMVTDLKEFCKNRSIMVAPFSQDQGVVVVAKQQGAPFTIAVKSPHGFEYEVGGKVVRDATEIAVHKALIEWLGMTPQV